MVYTKNAQVAGGTTCERTSGATNRSQMNKCANKTLASRCTICKWYTANNLPMHVVVHKPTTCVCVNLASMVSGLCDDEVSTHTPVLQTPLGAAVNKD
jgi:hypothetical protein